MIGCVNYLVGFMAGFLSHFVSVGGDDQKFGNDNSFRFSSLLSKKYLGR